MSESASFRDLEYAGWTARAGAYDDWFAAISRQAIDPLLDALAVDYSGKHLLDVCAGTGHLVNTAALRGAAQAEGVDFAATMIERARSNYPTRRFHVGDAQALPFGDATFDLVSCSFGLLHLDDPETAIAEAWRVLRPGGRYAFTIWSAPTRGTEFFAIVSDAVERYGTLEPDLPEGPPKDRFDDRAETRLVLERAGFADVADRRLAITWHPESGDALLTLIYKSIVRTPMLLEGQTDAARARIHRAIVEQAESLRRDEVIEIAFPAALFAATKRP